MSHFITSRDHPDLINTDHLIAKAKYRNYAHITLEQLGYGDMRDADFGNEPRTRTHE